MKTRGNRVFIVGAGFSKPCGLPLAWELTRELIERLSVQHPNAGLTQWLPELNARLCRKRPGEYRSMEELCYYTTIEAELYRAQQHIMDIGRTAGETPWQRARDLEGYVQSYSRETAELLVEREAAADLRPAIRWAETVNEGDVVISFNYDTIVERALDHCEVRWSYGFDLSDYAPSVLLLKLHGSVNWVQHSRNIQWKKDLFTELYRKKDQNRERVGLPTSPIGEHEYDTVLSWYRPYTGIREFRRSLPLGVEGEYKDHAVLAMGDIKRISSIPGLGYVWFQSIQQLSRCSSAIAVGFSFSEYDRLALHVISEGLHNHVPDIEDFEGVHLIGPDVEDIQRRVETATSQRIIPHKARHEEFDWESLCE